MCLELAQAVAFWFGLWLWLWLWNWLRCWVMLTVSVIVRVHVHMLSLPHVFLHHLIYSCDHVLVSFCLHAWMSSVCLFLRGFCICVFVCVYLCI